MTMGTNLRCQIVCWVIAAIVGITFLALWVAFGLWALVGFLGGIVAAAVTGWLLSRVMCSDLNSEAADRQAMHDVAARALGQSPAAAPTTAPAAARAVAEDPAAAAAHHSAPATEAPAPAAPSTEDDGAQEAEDAALTAAPGASEVEAVPAADPAPEAHPGAPGMSAVEVDEPEAAPAPAAPASAAATEEGTRPAGLDAAREGGPDNLKEIKGVGPKLEQLLHTLGYYHFDQIAGWTDDEVTWVDQNLQGFKGRVTRDNWVEQARILASGGETEFSKKVDRGQVY